MHSFADQIENAFVRAAVYRIVGALEHGHGTLGTIVIAVAIIAVVYAIKRFGPK